MIKKVLLNRNILLVLAIFIGILFPRYSQFLKEYIILILGIVMTVSLSAISLKALFPLKKVIKPMLVGILLNHIIYGVFIIIVAYIYKFNINLFYGFIVIAATPPGVAIIPFTYKLKGNLDYSIFGTFGAFLASIILAPFLIYFFIGSTDVSPFRIFKTMTLLIIIPLFLSRFLLLKKIKEITINNRGRLIDIGFALIIYTSVGLNSEVFYKNYLLLISIFFAFVAIMFGIGKIIGLILQKSNNQEDILSKKLLFAIKSSGFAVVTSIDTFGVDAAIPATIMSIVVIVYLLALISFKRIL
ncbi:MAG: hypothetical protein JXR51_00245 [Bacteroidales bacterium]|nr:hypothetical protein [Bacteroidales bacterium]MBN2755570.1 hypothetical protein [Bacteroidales bacterium]